MTPFLSLESGVQDVAEGQSKEGVLGDEWLLDHVHPSIQGHQLIADSLYEAMEDMKLISKPDGWRAARDKLWQDHLSSLNEAYFEQGFTRLKRLHNWSRGPMGDLPPAASDSKED